MMRLPGGYYDQYAAGATLLGIASAVMMLITVTPPFAQAFLVAPSLPSNTYLRNSNILGGGRPSASNGSR